MLNIIRALCKQFKFIKVSFGKSMIYFAQFLTLMIFASCIGNSNKSKISVVKSNTETQTSDASGLIPEKSYLDDGQVSINNNAPVTGSPNIIVQIEHPTAAEFYVSDQPYCLVDLAWYPMVKEFSWVLPPHDINTFVSTKSIYVKFRDTNKKETRCQSTSILFDSGPPVIGGVSINNYASKTNTHNVTIITTGSVGAVEMAVNNGATCDPNAQWIEYNKELPWTLDTGITNATLDAAVQYRDNVGNISQCYNPHILHDNIPPTIAITVPANNSYIKASDNSIFFNVQGTCNQSGREVNLKMLQYGIEYSSNTVICTSGLFNTYISTIEMVEGSIQLVAEHSDDAGNLQTTTINLTKDTIINLSFLTAVPTKYISTVSQSDIDLTGTCSASDNGDTITLNIKNGAVTEFTDNFTCNSGSWNYLNLDSTPLSQANLIIELIFTDTAGNSKTINYPIIKDLTLPSGTLTFNDAVVSSTTAPAIISSTPSDVESMYITTDVTCNTGSTWESFSPSKNITLSPGSSFETITYYIKFRDHAQNESACLAGDSIIYDYPPPTVTANNVSMRDATNLDGDIAADNITAYTLSGTCSENTRSVNVTFDDGVNSPILDGAICTGNIWTTTTNLSLSTLAEGTDNIKVTITHSKASNSTVTTTIPNLSKDTIAPNTPILLSPTQNIRQISSSFNASWSIATPPDNFNYELTACSNLACTTNCASSSYDTQSPTTINDLRANTNLYVCIRTLDEVGNTSAWVTSAPNIVHYDLSVPGPPTNIPPSISDEYQHSNSYSLTGWTPSPAPDVLIHQWKACLNGSCEESCTSIVEENNPATSVLLTPLQLREAYTICGRAIDPVGYTTSWYPSANTVTYDPVPIDAIDFRVTSSDFTSMTLGWTSPGIETADYRLAYKLGSTAPVDCASDTQIGEGSIDENNNTITIENLNGTEYSFRLCSINSRSPAEVSSGVTTTGKTKFLFMRHFFDNSLTYEDEIVESANFDSDKNIYVCGGTVSDFAQPLAGSQNGFITKFDSKGQNGNMPGTDGYTWAYQLGSSGYYSTVYACKVDNNGNNLYYSGSINNFFQIGKIDSNTGIPIWTNALDGIGTNETPEILGNGSFPHALVLDNDNNPISIATVYNPVETLRVMKFDKNDGSLLWVNDLDGVDPPGAATNNESSIANGGLLYTGARPRGSINGPINAITDDHYVYVSFSSRDDVAGLANGIGFISNSGVNDRIIARFDLDNLGALDWIIQLNGLHSSHVGLIQDASGWERAGGISLGQDGQSLLLSGTTDGNFAETSAGNNDCYIAKLNKNDGSLQNLLQLGANSSVAADQEDYCQGDIQEGPNNYIYFSGSTHGYLQAASQINQNLAGTSGLNNYLAEYFIGALDQNFNLIWTWTLNQQFLINTNTSYAYWETSNKGNINVDETGITFVTSSGSSYLKEPRPNETVSDIIIGKIDLEGNDISLCVNGDNPVQIFNENMVGCGGQVDFPNRATLCGPNAHVCTRQEFSQRYNGQIILYNYYLDNKLQVRYDFLLISPINVVSSSPGSDCSFPYDCDDCGASGAAGICKSSMANDAEGNRCLEYNLTYGHSGDSIYGGCMNGDTASVLCCK